MQPSIQDLRTNSKEAAAFLKGLSHHHRLMVLCALAMGERSVAELIEYTGASQTTMSQHLAKLKSEGLVDFRRDHRTLYYYIKDADVLRIIGILYDMYAVKEKHKVKKAKKES